MTVWLRPSSNRTGGFPASGSPRAIHAHRFYARACFHAAHVGSRYRPQRSRRDFPWRRRPQVPRTSAFAPQPALHPVRHKLVHPVKHPRAVGVMEIPAPAFEQTVEFRDDFVRRTPERPVVEFFPNLSRSLVWLLGWGSMCG